MTRASPIAPFAIAALGIAVFSGMDAIMKRLSIDSGAYAAVCWRSVAAVGLMAPLYARRRRWPDAATLRLHIARALAAGSSVSLFFWGLARVPMAQGVAITFLAPLMAIFLAAATLGERVRRTAVLGSGTAMAGVLVIAAGDVGGAAPAVVMGSVAIFAASILYAVSLVLLRRQAQAAAPIEVAFFSSLVIGLAMLPASPWLAGLPAPGQLPAILGAAVLSTVSITLMAWAYARAEAQVVALSEYTAFGWSALFGWLVFGERVSGWTLGGAALIVAGCAVALRRPAAGVPLTEAGA